MKNGYFFNIASKAGFGVAWLPLKEWYRFRDDNRFAWFFSIKIFDAGLFLMYDDTEIHLPKRMRICLFGLLISIPLSLKKQHTQ